MTQVYGESGKAEAITAIEAGPCTVTQIKTEDSDGYSAVQLGFGEARNRKRPAVKKALKKKPRLSLNTCASSNSKTPRRWPRGRNWTSGMFKAGDKVDVIGISKGKGFAGGVKRYHFHGGPKTHGQSDRWRAPGSVGSNTTPGRVFKGLRMAGHMGSQRVTASNLTVLQADPERNLILIKGAVPGTANGMVLVGKSRKGKK